MDSLSRHAVEQNDRWRHVALEHGQVQAAIASLTAASGTADGTVADVGTAFDQATLNNNFQEMATKINAILVALRNTGVIRE